MELGAVALIDAVVALDPAELRHFLGELVQIIGVDVGVLVGAQGVELDGAVSGAALTVEHVLDDGLLVDGVVQHADGVRVLGPEVRGHGHGGAAVVGGGEDPLVVAVLALKLRGVVGVQPGEIRLAGLQHGGLRALNGDGLVDQIFNVRNLVVVVGVRLHGDHAAGGVPLNELVAAGADRRLVEGAGGNVLALEQVLGDDADGEVAEHVRVILAELDGDLVVAGGLDADDVLIVRAQAAGKRIVLSQLFIGEDHVFGGEGLAVVPLDAVTQGEDIGEGVLVIAVLGCEIGHGLAVAVILHQAGEDDVGDLIVVGEQRVDGVLVFAGVDEGVGRVHAAGLLCRFGLRLGGACRSGLLLAAAGGQREAQHENQKQRDQGSCVFHFVPPMIDFI